MMFHSRVFPSNLEIANLTLWWHNK